jgi:hypothetical protein
MRLINQGKTNWKYLMAVLILAAAAGAAILISWSLKNEVELSGGDKKSVISNDSGRIMIEDIKYPLEFKGVFMELRIENGQMSALSKPKIANNGYPNYLPGAYDLAVKVISSSGDILGEYGINDPRMISGEQGYQGPAWLDSVDFVLIVPYFEDAQKIDIFSPVQLMLSVDISNITAE